MLTHLYEEGYQANTFSPSAPPPPHVSTALIAIGQYSSTIETVDAGWCKDITDQGATQIAQSSKSLRYLGLMRCDKVRRSCQRSRLECNGENLPGPLHSQKDTRFLVTRVL